MSFGIRNGFESEKLIQIDSIDATLRNRLNNVIHKYLSIMHYDENVICYVADRLGFKVKNYPSGNMGNIDKVFFDTANINKWYMPYEIIELFFEAKKYHDCEYIKDIIWYEDFPKEINKILEEEKSGYRLLNYEFVNIIDQTELKEIEEATNTEYDAVNMHLKKAISLYASKEKPDYENSIKESITAVESMCKNITANSKATLGDAINLLKDKGIVIHPAMIESFKKLYGYTSDESGIRHGGIDFKNAPSEDAKFMLITCSAFVNYLKEKVSKTSVGE